MSFRTASMPMMLAASALALAPASAAPMPAPGQAETSAEAAPTADSAKLVLASKIADAILPPGTYRELMAKIMGPTMNMAMKQVGAMPLRSFLTAANVDPSAVKAIGPATLDQIMAIIDPSYQQRMGAAVDVMTRDMSDMMSQFEPDMRAGMMQAYARRYTTAQLADIEGFFKTPTGREFASQIMLIGTDPAVMQKMQAMMPKVMQGLPKMVADISEATKNMPQPKKYQDLSKAEKTKLATLLGIDPGKMK